MSNLTVVPLLKAPSSEQLAAVRRLVVSSLIARGSTPQDAEDAAQQALVKIVAQPERFQSRLSDLEAHRLYFLRMALNEYLMQLRSERRRRRREELHVRSTARLAGGVDDGADVAEALALIQGAPLTNRQRSYLRAVLVERLSVEQLAARTRTTPRAVRGVLERAVKILHEQKPAAA